MKLSRTYRLDEELVKDIQDLAEHEQRTESAMVQLLLKEIMDAKAKHKLQ